MKTVRFEGNGRFLLEGMEAPNIFNIPLPARVMYDCTKGKNIMVSGEGFYTSLGRVKEEISCLSGDLLVYSID